MKIATIFLLEFLFSFSLFGQSNNGLLQITHLTGDFYIFTTYKDYQGTPFSANGLYLVTNAGVVMIDSPWDTTQFQPLLDSIKLKHNKDVVMCVATHSHEDRTGGLKYYGQKGIKTYTTEQTYRICKAKGENLAEYRIQNDTIFKVGQYSFETYFAGAGHSPDNIVIWFEKSKVLYGGCLIKSVEANDLGNLGDANTKEWPKTIKKIQGKFEAPNYVIPGHQNWTDNSSLDHTLQLLKQHNK